MTPAFIESIEDYLNGKISRASLEKIAEEQGISNLDEEIEWYKDSLSAIRTAGFRNQLKTVLPSPEKKPSKIRSINSNRWLIGIAASFLLVAVAYFAFSPKEKSELYAKYEYIDPGLPVLMSQSDDYLLYDAMSYFGEENYSVAEEKLLQLQEEQLTVSDTISYYLAASQLYQGKTDLAEASLEQVTNDNSSEFKQKAEWLKILTALKANNKEKAQQLLEVILAASDHDFYAQAQALQKDLNQ